MRGIEAMSGETMLPRPKAAVLRLKKAQDTQAGGGRLEARYYHSVFEPRREGRVG